MATDMNMNWLDWGGGRFEVPFTEPDFYALDGRCEDDDTVICPYIDLMPEESKLERPIKPLNFGDDGSKSAGTLFDQWLKKGDSAFVKSKAEVSFLTFKPKR